MKASLSILCFNQVDTTRRCIDHLEQHTDLSDVECLLTDNGSSDNTRAFLKECDLPHKRVIAHHTNIGFGPGHNYALHKASGEYFIILNNDLFIEDSLWIEKLIAPLEDHRVALVGLSDAPCTLDNDGNGYVGLRIDYLDGACIAGRSELLRRHGLFSPALRMFSFEDSDLSLRYRQAGYKLRRVRIQHRHHRGSSRGSIDRQRRQAITAHNQRVFLTRWGKSMKMSGFTNRILVRIPSWGIGDVLAVTPVMAALRRDHPRAHLHVETLHPEVFSYNPHVYECTQHVRHSCAQFDRVIDLNPNYAGTQPIFKQCAEIAATTIEDGTPQIFLDPREIQWADALVRPLTKGQRPLLLCHFALHHSQGWHGRSWSMRRAWEFVNRLRLHWANTVGIVEVGKEMPSTGRAHLDLVGVTTLRQLFALVARATLVVCIDSLVSHVARAFQIPSVVLFGATDPRSRVLRNDLERPIQRDDLNCVGCYQRQGIPVLNICDRGETCMNIPGETVYRLVEEILRGTCNDRT